MSNPQEKCIAQISSCQTKYRRYSHQRPEISTTSSSSLARSCAQSLAMTISSTRSIGLPENEVGSAVETEVIKPSPGGSTAHPPLDHDGPEILRLGGSTHLAQSKLPMCNNRRKSIFGALSSATAKVKRDRELWRRPPDFPASRAPRELRVAIPVRLSALPDLPARSGRWPPSP